MAYNKFIYLYPPRAENAIPPHKLDGFQRTHKDWIAQYKKNGTNSVIFVPPDRDKLFAMGRENNQHKQWQFTPASAAIFKALPGKGWYVINAELLHSKVVGLRDTNYIHDILVEDGEYLLGSTYAERHARLLMTFLKDKAEGPPSHFVLDNNTWLAKNHKGSFKALFDSLEKPEDEGIVLKNPQARLATKNNPGWSVKSRRPHANFPY